jgi:hypothetical protein
MNVFEPCALLSFSISYWDLIKFPYFADTTEWQDRDEREGDFTDNLKIWTYIGITSIENPLDYKFVLVTTILHSPKKKTQISVHTAQGLMEVCHLLWTSSSAWNGSRLLLQVQAKSGDDKNCFCFFSNFKTFPAKSAAW